jgi:hypothetical protein
MARQDIAEKDNKGLATVRRDIVGQHTGGGIQYGKIQEKDI